MKRQLQHSYLHIQLNPRKPRGLLRLPSLTKDAEFGKSGAVQAFFDRAKSSLQQQDISGATYQLQQAFQVAPDSAAVNFNLALLYQANEKPMSAVKHAQNYLNLAPNALDRGDIQNRIAELQKTLQENTYVERHQTGCFDIANWARLEEAAAKSDAARRPAILEIRTAAQRGDCDKARALETAYKQRYQRPVIAPRVSFSHPPGAAHPHLPDSRFVRSVDTQGGLFRARLFVHKRIPDGNGSWQSWR